MIDYICLTLADADATPLHLPKGAFAFLPLSERKKKDGKNFHPDWGAAATEVWCGGDLFLVRETEAEIKRLVGITR